MSFYFSTNNFGSKKHIQGHREKDRAVLAQELPEATEGKGVNFEEEHGNKAHNEN